MSPTVQDTTLPLRLLNCCADLDEVSKGPPQAQGAEESGKRETETGDPPQAEGAEPPPAEEEREDPSAFLRLEGEEVLAYATRIFTKVYRDDIVRLAGMEVGVGVDRCGHPWPPETSLPSPGADDQFASSNMLGIIEPVSLLLALCSQRSCVKNARLQGPPPNPAPWLALPLPPGAVEEACGSETPLRSPSPCSPLTSRSYGRSVRLRSP